MDIVYQDNRIVVVNKPAGILTPNVPDLLRNQLHTDCFRTVHRLDGQTSGLLLLARSSKATSLLSNQLMSGRFTKEYLAVVHGSPPSDGTLTDWLQHDSKSRRTYVANGPCKDAKYSSLTYQLIAKKNGLSLLKIQLQTGRTHQIRVQFASRGFPLWNDRKYGDPEDGSMALFCCHIGFTHPQSGEQMDFTLFPTGGIWNMFIES